VTPLTVVAVAFVLLLSAFAFWTPNFTERDRQTLYERR
jgi:hypothetical protein